MKRLIPLACILPLASCGMVPQSNVTDCAAALALSGQREVAGLLKIAAATPACQALAQEALNAAIREAILRAR